MICSETLPSAGRDGGNLEVKDAGRDQTTSTDLPAIEALQDDANGTGVLDAKTQASEPDKPTPPSTLREFEHALRGLGFTRKQAASIAKHGFTQASDAQEAEDSDTKQLSEVLAALRRNTALLKHERST